MAKENKPIWIKQSCAIYIRVSTLEQAQEGLSIEAQKSRLTEYAEKHHWDIYNYYIDPGYSGSNTNRPAFQQLMRDVVLRKFKFLLVYKLDRLHRNLFQLLQTINKLKEYRIHFISSAENIDTSTAVGMMQLGILGTIAEFERNATIERVKLVFDDMEKKGHIYLHLPMGYRSIKQNGHVIAVEPDKKAPIVQDIFRAKLYGKPVKWICSSTGLQVFSLYRILHNPFYAGYVRFRGKWFKMPHEKLISLKKWFMLTNGNREAYENATIIDVFNEKKKEGINN